MAIYPLLRPLLFLADAETTHRSTIAALRVLPRRAPPTFPQSLGSEVAGLGFPSPVGLAAGFDKDAVASDALLGLGFGFVEVGTLTPLAQPGNPRPRLFRLVEDEAVINRMGFNNRGQDDALKRLARRDRSRGPSTSLRTGIVGVNLGANKDSADPIADYAAGVARMSAVADYLTVNISSPNTPGLRALQDAGALRELLAAVAGARGAAGSAGRRPPLFLKIAPDLGEADPERIVRAAIDLGVDGLIIANTTTSRPPLRSRHGLETGGLSGAPLAPLALAMLRSFRSVSGGAIPLIATGGIATVDDAWQRIRAGASLVQLYTALVYHGPGLARRIAAGLAERLERQGFATVAEAVGTG